jgi:hypothetical protein
MSGFERAPQRELVHVRRSSTARARLHRTLLGGALIALGTFAVPHSAVAQGHLQEAVTVGGVDSIPATAPMAVKRSRVLPYVFFGAMAAGLAVNSFVHVDRDPGGYHDTWNTETQMPDKIVHGLAAFALTSVGVDLKVRPLISALTTCATGAIFEKTQGYVSRYDIGADCAGAALAGLWRHWRAR